jgi:hypothetical protein
MPNIYSPITLHEAPTSLDHVPRWGDVIALYDAKFKMPVRLAALTNLAGSYAAKVLTGSAPAPLVIDGKNAVAGDRVLLAGQTAAALNGIYTVTAAGSGAESWVLTRATDFDESSKVYSGVKVTVTEGTSSHEVTYVLATDGAIVLDSTGLNFTADTGNAAGGAAVREYSGTVAAGDSMPKTFTHNMGTLKVTVDIFRDSDGATVFADVTRPDANSVTVLFGANPVEDFTVLVRAEV